MVFGDGVLPRYKGLNKDTRVGPLWTNGLIKRRDMMSFSLSLPFTSPSFPNLEKKGSGDIFKGSSGRDEGFVW
jgi:hypothetical protein